MNLLVTQSKNLSVLFVFYLYFTEKDYAIDTVKRR